MTDNSITFCSSDNGDGCGGIFPRKTVEGLCLKCSKLSELQDGGPEYERWKSFPQCTSCGVAWKHLSGAVCARCVTAGGVMGSGQGGGGSGSMGPPAFPDFDAAVKAALDAAKAKRAQSVDARFMKPSGSSAPKLLTDETINVYLACRVVSAKKNNPSKPDIAYGSWAEVYKKSVYLTEVFDDALNTVNVRWTKKFGRALIPSEADLRWSGGKTFNLKSSSADTIGNIYDRYLTGDLATFYKGAKTGGAHSSKPKLEMSFELFVDKEEFDERMRLEGQAALKSTRKRSGTYSTLETVPHQKRHMGESNVSLASCFVRSQAPAIGTASSVSSNIYLRLAHAVCDDTNGQVQITWPGNSDPTAAVITHSLLARGKTKNVYELAIGSKLYVAKRFFDVGNETLVSAEENSSNLQLDFIRLEILRWFLTRFKKEAENLGVEYDSNIVVTDAFLAREVGVPSPPSDLPPSDVHEAVWLIEPRRTKAVWKHSGTMAHPNRKDQCSQTLSALLHYIYANNEGKLVFADIQGSKMPVKGRDTLVLFDPMSHSVEGDSGIGDHGPDGIAQFEAQHRCNYVCHMLKLRPLVAQGSVDDDENDIDDQSDG